MQNSLNKRIKEIISLDKLSDTQFANKIGVPQTTVSNIFKRDSDVKSSLLNRILDVYPYVSPTWLLRGKGEMYLQDNAVMLSAETTGGIPEAVSAARHLHFPMPYRVPRVGLAEADEGERVGRILGVRAEKDEERTGGNRQSAA